MERQKNKTIQNKINQLKIISARHFIDFRFILWGKDLFFKALLECNLLARSCNCGLAH